MMVETSLQSPWSLVTHVTYGQRQEGQCQQLFPPHFFSFTLILSPNFFNKKCIQLMCLLCITRKFLLKGEAWGKLYNFIIGFIGAKHFNFLDFGFVQQQVRRH